MWLMAIRQEGLIGWGGGHGGGGNDKMREIEREAIKGKDKIQMFRG